MPGAREKNGTRTSAGSAPSEAFSFQKGWRMISPARARLVGHAYISGAPEASGRESEREEDVCTL